MKEGKKAQIQIGEGLVALQVRSLREPAMDKYMGPLNRHPLKSVDGNKRSKRRANITRPTKPISFSVKRIRKQVLSARGRWRVVGGPLRVTDAKGRRTTSSGKGNSAHPYQVGDTPPRFIGTKGMWARSEIRNNQSLNHEKTSLPRILCSNRSSFLSRGIGGKDDYKAERFKPSCEENDTDGSVVGKPAQSQCLKEGRVL